MAINSIKRTGTANAHKSDSAGTTLVTEPVIGIVKNNIDPTRSGKIQVYIDTLCGTDPDNSQRWLSVRYMSPFYGVSRPGGDRSGGADKSGNGEFVGNPHSYGMWTGAPDIGTKVMCIFANGTVGYYIGCIPEPGLLQMTPALGSSDNVVPNGTEGDSYGGAERLPVSEINMANPALSKSVQQHAEPKSVHSSQASIYQLQGLTRDPVRGPITSSAQRETPSRVFGISTPGGPIFEGGYNTQTIRAAAKGGDPSKLKQIGRTGGHTFVMDDGTIDGADQLVRLRTSAGHQIMMNDSGQALFIIHANGQSWIELGKEGTIDMYSTNSVNVRTQGDLNLHADRNININADKNLNLYGENINIESSKAMNQRVGTNFTGYTMGSFTMKVDGSVTQSVNGSASYLSKGDTTIQASKIDLNPGSAPEAPKVEPIPKTNHLDTTNSPTVGWMSPGPTPLISITNRAPAHQPWVGSSLGVDVKISSQPTPDSQQTTPAADAVNSGTPSAPTAPTSAAEIAAVPSNVAAAGPMTSDALKASAAQIATNAQATVASGVKPPELISAASGLTTNMAEQAGLIKAEAAGKVNDLVSKGMSMEKALQSVGTGVAGVANAATLVTDVAKQAETVVSAVADSTNKLMSLGSLTGNESPAQAAGLALAATTQGVAAVTGALSSGVANAQGLANDIASGKFAGALADKSIGGLKTSLSGMMDGSIGKVTALGDQVANLKDNLKSGLQNAFASVEKSFGKLKAGMPNKLGPPKNSDGTPAPSAATVSANTFESAKAEVESATDSLFAVRRAYRDDPTPDMQAKVQEAEAALASARQKEAQASAAFLKSATGSMPGVSQATAALTGSLDTIKTSLNSGLNALPGGPAALQSIIKNTPLAGVAAQVGTAANMIGSAMKTADQLSSGSLPTGDLMAKAKGAATDMMGKVTSGLPDLKSGVSGMMAQLEATMSGIPGGAGAIKAAAAATGTFDNSAIMAKTGQLLGNPKIPLPFPPDSPPKAQPDQMSAETAAAFEEVKTATSRVNAAKFNVSLTLPTGNQEKIAEAQAALKKEEDALRAAQDSYTTLIQG